ncbi:aspartate ammonia-lyase [Natranaerobius thermophilus]|uniref:aspartate ammonia-lyase n=1 Tax=Natranaerobius thermophilus (strain ATCC BAA-1301 / DSM 18059 / JW/NM-WN-LF) TaxID=457570 RepID=B2A2B6_NATTJ|nr:aspartate ammonia-lyase [Natranaerobius thermophilus]ACB86222.1 fumarase [Natranaerobius thermophilus JW/NM-WN-LF]
MNSEDVKEITRVECDSLGSKEIPKDAYYGIQSKRAQENFPLSGYRVHPELIKAMGKVKYASVVANMKTGKMPNKSGEAIKQACEEMSSGKFFDAIVVEAIQGGAGTSINMNVNEILANRAIEILGHEKGDYDVVSPNTHVNMSQSTNDVVPTSFKLAVITMREDLISKLENLYQTLSKKEQEFDKVIKTGRTHLQDAVPIRLGQEFGAYARFVKRDIERISNSIEALKTVNLGATAVGTGLNADSKYINTAIEELREITGIDLEISDHLVDATQNTDAYVHVSGALKTAALNMSKMANDLRLMSSGPRCGFKEIKLPAVQPGSSIMPGKVNPVIPEVINQICFQVAGNDHTISMASEAGQLELNVMGPVLFRNMFESMEIIANGAHILSEKCIKGIEPNHDRCNELVENSIGIITALNPHIGYETASEIAKEVLETGRSVRDVILEREILTEEEIEDILDPKEMTEPGIAGKKKNDVTA